jgi:hypothetical protein
MTEPRNSAGTRQFGSLVPGVFTPVLTKKARRGWTVGKAFMARLRSAREWPERLRRMRPCSKKSRILRTVARLWLTFAPAANLSFISPLAVSSDAVIPAGPTGK